MEKLRIENGLCPFCEQVKGRNIYRHLFDVHWLSKAQIDDMKVRKKRDAELQCDCGKTYRSIRALRRHLKKREDDYRPDLMVSRPTPDHHVKTAEMQPGPSCFSKEESDQKSTTGTSKIVQCRFCKRWMQRTSYSAHISNIHGGERFLGHCFDCPICDYKIRLQEDLVDHCRIEHGDAECVVDTKVFENMAECQAWKRSVMKTHRTYWMVVGRTKNETREVVFYRCSRVLTRPSKQKIKPLPKSYVRCCTSFLKEHIYPNGVVSVKYCIRHVSHDLSVATLPLSNSEKEIILDLLAKGHSVAAVRQKIRSDYTRSSSKLFWIRDEDIRSLMQTRALEKGESEKGAGSASVNSFPGETEDEMAYDCDEDSYVSAATLLQESGAIMEEPEDDDCKYLGNDRNHFNDRMKLEESNSTTEEDCIECDTSYAVPTDIANDTPFIGTSASVENVQDGTIPSCLSCVKLNQRVNELETTLKVLKRQLKMEFGEEQALFDDVVKPETD